MSKKRFRVRLVRPVFQVAVVDVEANGEEEAMMEALIQAESVPEKEWVGEFDPDSYFYDAQYVEEAGEAGEAENPEDDYIFTGIDEDRKYLLLKANTGSGEGEVIFQPWLSEISELMVADLFSDWSGQMQELEEVGVAIFYESLEKQLQVKNKALAKVIPFRRPDSSDSD